MQEIFKQIIALVVGGVLVGLIMIFAERNVERTPELLILHQNTAIPDEFVRAAIKASFEHMNSEFNKNIEPISPDRLSKLENTLMVFSGFGSGGYIDTYYIKNESKDEAITFQILSRDFEFAVLGGDSEDKYFQEDIDIEIRLLPKESVYLSITSNDTPFYGFPRSYDNEQQAFFAIKEKPIVPTSLSDYSPYDLFPEKFVKKYPTATAFLSFLGVLMIIFIVVNLVTNKKIPLLARLSSVNDIAQYQLVIEYIRDHNSKKFMAIEAAVEDLRKKP